MSAWGSSGPPVQGLSLAVSRNPDAEPQLLAFSPFLEATERLLWWKEGGGHRTLRNFVLEWEVRKDATVLLTEI